MIRLALLSTAVLLCGCIDPSSLKPAAVDEDSEPAAEAQPAPPGVAPVGVQVGPGHQGVIEARIVDKQQVLADNPDLVQVENGISAKDPFTAASQSYFNLASRAELLAFQHNIQVYYFANDERYPSYEQFMDLFRTSGVKLRGLKPWQMYAYDSSDGTICILEDPTEKARRREEAGLEPEA